MILDRTRLIAAVILAATIASALVLVALINSARDDGLEALRDSKLEQVVSAARTFDQRQVNQFESARALSQQGFEVTVGSVSDQAFVDGLFGLIVDPEAGFFLVNLDHQVTAGVLLTRGTAIGDRYDRPGFDELVGSERFRDGRGGVLPVGPGITTAAPTTAAVFPVLRPDSGALQGAAVVEVVVGPDTDFSREIAALPVEGTAEWLFIDTEGSVVSSTDPSTIGTRIEQAELVTLPIGLHRVDGELVAIEDVPASGWRLVFRQDRGEFEAPLRGPLQGAGTVIVIAIVAAGGLVTLTVVRRLRHAREEQRRLTELVAQQEEFVSIVSHELRTPVAGVTGFLQTSVDHWDEMSPDDRRHAVEAALSNARRLQALTRDVLEAEQAEAGRLRIVTEVTDAWAVIRVNTELAGQALSDTTINLELPLEPAQVSLDPDRIGQVLTNLITNAAKNSPPDRPVEVVGIRRDDGIEIEVRDRGRGLDPAMADHVFEKFARGSDTVEGSGLGLSIARSIVEAHGGRIWAEDGDGGGAVFRFVLPFEQSGATEAL
ncbi:MAG TPA: HAMP domain-containing sensor histidine kinase [Acidimicrobiales bacterium]